VDTVTLGGKDARYDGKRKSVQERTHDTLFDTIIEVKSSVKWLVHRDAKHAVDEALAGRRPVSYLREHLPDGRMMISKVAM
jgi:hypothetical protein